MDGSFILFSDQHLFQIESLPHNNLTYNNIYLDLGHAAVLTTFSMLRLLLLF